MESLQSQNLWDLMLARQADLRKQAQREHLARMAEQRQPGLWQNLFRRRAQNPTLAPNPSATLELGSWPCSGHN